MDRHRTSAALLAGDCAARGVRVRARRSLTTGVSVPFYAGGPPMHARARSAGWARCGILDPCGATRGDDSRLDGLGGALGRGGVPQRARHVSMARAATLRRCPGEGPGRFRCGGRGPPRVAEFGPNLASESAPAGGSREIERDRGRSNEIGRAPARASPIRRSISPAARVLDPARPGSADLETAELDR